MTTVTVLRTERGPHGDPTGPPVESVVEGCIVAPRRSSEDDERGEAVIVGLSLFAPFDADIKATDQIRIDDAAWRGTYDVVGEPGRWENPFTGKRPGMEVALTRHS